MRVVFMGTPAFAEPSLRALAESGRYEVVGVVCQPDRPKGRSGKPQACPAKQCALSEGIPVYQFERIRRPEGVQTLRALAPDVCVTAAFGQILSQELLDIPRLGTVNVHASLLPKYRGSAPINWCLINGETETGVTTMLTDKGMDTGDILLSARTPIGPNETAGELTQRLSVLGAQLLLQTLQQLEAGVCPRTPQNPDEASYYPLLKKETGLIDWTQSARTVFNLVRGVDPWPGAYTPMEGGTLKVWKAAAHAQSAGAQPGMVLRSSAREGLFVATGDGVLELLEIQAPGSRRMNAKDYLRGHAIPAGTLLGKAE